jgi:nucleotide-binding universal stress UspA family protein
MERLRKIEVHFTVKTGFASDEILWLAKHIESDMIVMGTRGAGNIGGMLLGSNASTVLQKSECPVLIVPESAEFAGCRKIAYATDMLEVKVEAIGRLVDFARHFDADLHLVHILTNKDRLNPSQASAFKEQFAQAAQYEKLTFHVVDAEGRTVVEALENFVDENDINLLATLTHHRGFFEKIFHPSLSKQLVIHAKIPVVAFH